MLSEFIDKIVSLSSIKIAEIGGRPYTKDDLSLVKPPQHTPPRGIIFSSLESLACFVESEKIDQDKIEDPESLFLKVDGPDRVEYCGSILPLNENRRFCYGLAELSGEAFEFGAHNWLDIEMFVISLQSMFIMTPGVVDIISMLSHLANETVKENHDNGFSQSLQIKTGLISKSEVLIENPVVLHPYRTFREVDQPESNCILRFRKMKSRSDQDDGRIVCALFEADGGAWKLAAMENIKNWLKDRLPGTTVI